MSSIEELISAIQKNSKMTLEQINDLIEDKSIEFSGMITKEAAAHLIARELGVEMPKTESTRLQIKNIVPGMRGINLIGRIFKISPVTNFQKKNGDKGKVSNLFISDGTGYIRVPLWNDQVKLVEEEIVKVGDAIQVFGGMSKDNIYGEVEISVGKFGGVRKMDDDYATPSLESIGKLVMPDMNKRVSIAELVPGNFEIKGTVVQVFKGNFIFETDAGEKSLVISCLLDDGSGDIRTVFFREQAEKVSGLKVKDLETLDATSKLELMKRAILGKYIVILGKVKNNTFFNSLEIIADSVKPLNALEESKRIAEDIESQIGA